MRLSSKVVTLACLMLISACGSGRLHTQDAWIRLLPGDLPAAGYVNIVNDSDQAVVLTRVSSDTYASAMLHQSVRENGQSRMRAVPRLTIPARTTLALKPGSYHLMLMQALHPLHPGDKVTITLHFEQHKSLPVSFVVKPAAS